MDNPFYLTMEEYLKMLQEVLLATGGGFFSRDSHPEDLSSAVESANSHLEAVLAYQVRKWYDDQKSSRIVTMPDDLSEEKAEKARQAYIQAYQKL
jgi:uncharacterized protein (DUF1330 family)